MRNRYRVVQKVLGAQYFLCNTVGNMFWPHLYISIAHSAPDSGTPESKIGQKFMEKSKVEVAYAKKCLVTFSASQYDIGDAQLSKTSYIFGIHLTQ